MSDAALIGSDLDLPFCSQLQVKLNWTHPIEQCLRNSKRTPRTRTTSSWEVISIGLCWCPEVSDCTPTNRSQCFWGRTRTSQMDTEPTCPPDYASKGEPICILNIIFTKKRNTLLHQGRKTNLSFLSGHSYWWVSLLINLPKMGSSIWIACR